MSKLKPDATGIYVAAHQAPAAIEEAIEAEVPLVVAVAEHIPIHSILRVGNMKGGIDQLLISTDTLNSQNSIKDKVCRG
jgi:succinyl-CoA synthetase alpha subunit